MSNKHTPGPWAVRESSLSVSVVGQNWEAVFHEPDKSIPGVMEDARLIAAAPELLEALRMWMEIHDKPAEFIGKFGKSLDAAIESQLLKIGAAADAARAAIAKATGG